MDSFLETLDFVVLDHFYGGLQHRARTAEKVRNNRAMILQAMWLKDAIDILVGRRGI